MINLSLLTSTDYHTHQKHKVTPKMFLEEFEILVESLISTSS